MNGRLLVFIILTMFLAACKDEKQSTQPNTAGLAGMTWQLTRIDSLSGQFSSPSQADTILLRFEDERNVSGASPGMCGNTYFGVYSLDSNQSVKFDSLASTKIYCSASLYWSFFTLLSKAESFQQGSNELKLYCVHDSVTLVLRLVQ